MDNKNIIFDCGPDFRAQMLNSKCNRVDAIFFTHEHNDHVSGLDDIRPFYFRQGSIPIYASDRVLSALNKRFEYVFKKDVSIPGTPNVITNIIEDNFIFNKQEIIVLNANHGNLPIHGFRFNNLAYFTDVKTIPKQEFYKLRDLDVLVINSLRIEEHYSHLNLNGALEIISKIKPKRAYLTHISH